MSSYILCKILSFLTRVAQKIFNRPGSYSISEAVGTEDCKLYEFIYTKLVIQIYVKERCLRPLSFVLNVAPCQIISGQVPVIFVISLFMYHKTRAQKLLINHTVRP